MRPALPATLELIAPSSADSALVLDSHLCSSKQLIELLPAQSPSFADRAQRSKHAPANPTETIMKRLVEFKLDDGTVILVESEEPESRGGAVVRGGGGIEVVEKAEMGFEAALGKIKPVATAFIARIRDLADAPEQVGIEFGIKLGAKAGAFIASADAEATFKVTMTWKRDAK